MKTADDFIRPSALQQLDRCPGAAESQAAVVNHFGEPKPAPEATNGTTCDRCVTEAIEAWRSGLEWGQAIALAVNEAAAAGLDKWSQRLCQEAAEFARDLIGKHEIDANSVLTQCGLAGESFGLSRGGTADLVLVDPGRKAWVLDWKFGHLDQGDADDHDQLQAYAGMAAETFRVPAVEVLLYQARMERGNKATAATFDAEGIRANAAWTRAVAAAARKPRAVTVAGYDQCKYCRALAVCQTARRYIQEASDLMDIILPETPAQLGGLIAAAKLASKFAKAAEELAKGEMIAGAHADGWKLAPSGTTTTIDPAEALRIAHEVDRLADLMQFATFKAEAAKVLDWIAPAVSAAPKAPSLKPDKGAA